MFLFVNSNFDFSISAETQISLLRTVLFTIYLPKLVIPLELLALELMAARLVVDFLDLLSLLRLLNFKGICC